MGARAGHPILHREPGDRRGIRAHHHRCVLRLHHLNAYEDADNGNRSAQHWDLVLIQTPEWGGGEIWFDEVLVRKDGRFVLPELDGLNPERLV